MLSLCKLIGLTKTQELGTVVRMPTQRMAQVVLPARGHTADKLQRLGAQCGRRGGGWGLRLSVGFVLHIIWHFHAFSAPDSVNSVYFKTPSFKSLPKKPNFSCKPCPGCKLAPYFPGAL